MIDKRILALVTFAAFAAAGPVLANGDGECFSGCDPEPREHADNGWGNGEDGDNPGTPKGMPTQAGTKLNELEGSGPLSRFDGR
ncbi:hypothetical protein [Defluviimonas sp. WL0075]|uniref:Uncharacterized protein n=1 Tax=Albidovulum sediminicola TaxID=2984331 RepID=A0ABT2YXD0_9RHOB|nr:hypothetical protein [Defluviimonas sp. WL0075]MCV2863176.1 hypothetical protein [Defluviimonas sp. WL0075]